MRAIDAKEAGVVDSNGQEKSAASMAKDCRQQRSSISDDGDLNIDIEGLSIFDSINDEVLLGLVSSADQKKKRSSSKSRRGDGLEAEQNDDKEEDEPVEETVLLRQLLKEQKKLYEQEIRDLRTEVARLRALIPADLQATASSSYLTDCSVNKWERINSVLGAYFQDVNAQI